MKWDVVLTLIIGGLIAYILYKTSKVYSYVVAILTIFLAYYLWKK